LVSGSNFLPQTLERQSRALDSDFSQVSNESKNSL